MGGVVGMPRWLCGVIVWCSQRPFGWCATELVPQCRGSPAPTFLAQSSLCHCRVVTVTVIVTVTVTVIVIVIVIVIAIVVLQASFFS